MSKVNVKMNIGLKDRSKKMLDMHKVIKAIGAKCDCTIIPAHGFYKGEYEPSLVVEIYDIYASKAQILASYFCYIFNQECVALTVEDITTFENEEHYLILKKQGYVA